MSDESAGKPAKVFNLAERRAQRGGLVKRTGPAKPAQVTAGDLAMTDATEFIRCLRQIPKQEAARVWFYFLNQSPDVLGPWVAQTNLRYSRLDPKTDVQVLTIFDEGGFWCYELVEMEVALDDENEIRRTKRGRADTFEAAVLEVESLAEQNGYTLIPSTIASPLRAVTGWSQLESIRTGWVLRYASSSILAAKIVQFGKQFRWELWAGSGKGPPTNGTSDSLDAAKRAVGRLLRSRKYSVE